MWPIQKQKDRAVLPKLKFIVYLGKSPDPNPKNRPEEPKKCKKGPKFGRMKNKKIGLYFQNKN